MSISTFSGAHPFRPQCLVDAYAAQMLDECDGDPVHAREIALEEVPALLTLIDVGRCPRCAGTYMKGEVPGGSQVTTCRCVPVCGVCGEMETFERLGSVGVGSQDNILAGLPGHIGNWPLDRADQAKRLAQIYVLCDPGTVEIDIADLKLSDTGGRASHGHDDTQDREERLGR